MKKTIIILLLLFVLTGCKKLEYKCEQKVLEIDVVCRGVLGCNYVYYLENGSKYNKLEIPAKQDENGNLCLPYYMDN